jgi:hypothetical protein
MAVLLFPPNTSAENEANQRGEESLSRGLLEK